LALFNFFAKKPVRFISETEEAEIVAAIRQAEQNTSGEIRIFMESNCRMVDPVDRAAELFYTLKMDETAAKNAVLVYIAFKDKQLALFADEGIYNKVGGEYWNTAVKDMLTYFKVDDFITGICKVVKKIGQTLQTEFPFQKDDKNELPDQIVFGN
jgi:uncharacterized membrane protein